MSAAAQCLGKGGGWTQREETMAWGPGVDTAAALLAHTGTGSSVPRKQPV